MLLVHLLNSNSFSNGCILDAGTWGLLLPSDALQWQSKKRSSSHVINDVQPVLVYFKTVVECFNGKYKIYIYIF